MKSNTKVKTWVGTITGIREHGRWSHNGFYEAIRNGEIEKIIDGRGDEIEFD